MLRSTAAGRAIVHDKLGINCNLMHQLMNQKMVVGSIEFYDNRISLYSAQWGKCYITGKEFLSLDDMHCHHKIAESKGGTDEYSNLVLVDKDVHRLIHATDIEVVKYYMEMLNLKAKQIEKLNRLRQLLGLPLIVKKKKSLTLSYNENLASAS